MKVLYLEGGCRMNKVLSVRFWASGMTDLDAGYNEQAQG